MSNLILAKITQKTILASTFSQAAYPNAGGVPFEFIAPEGFIKVEVTDRSYGRLDPDTGFAAVTYVNPVTGQVVIAYRGSDSPGEAVGTAAVSAASGYWNPQFTDATNYAKAAQAAAQAAIDTYGAANDIATPPKLDVLLTGHSLGGLLAQVVSKMYGLPAEVFDSLGGGKLVFGTDGSFKPEFRAQAIALGLADSSGNDVAKTQAVLGVLSLMGEAWAGPVGWAIVAYQIFGALFGDLFGSPPNPSAGGIFESNANGHSVHGTTTWTSDGGGTAMNAMLNNLVAALDSVLTNPDGSPAKDMGWMASRLPTLTFSNATYTLSITDTNTHQTHTRQFNTAGEFIGGSDVPTEAANHPDFFKNIVQQFVVAAITGGAMAQSWEVQTADSQTARGALITPTGTSQTLSPIVLDLDGNGITVTSKSTGNGVMIDVDGDGYAQESDWIGTRDGILALDRNGDGKINSLDAVYSHLQVWTDVNHDGVAQQYELSNLSIPTTQPNNGGLTPKAKGAQRNASNLTKGSDPNWLGGTGGWHGCKPIQLRLTENDTREAKNDMAYRLVA